MTTIILRKNQRELLEAMGDSARTKKKILAVAPCGFGKTVVFCEIAKKALKLGNKTLIIVHRDVLVKQAVEKLNHFGIEPGIIKGSVKEDRTKNVQVASAQTLDKRNIDWFDYKIIIVDEAHETTFRQSVLKLIKAENVFVLGFTATPWTLSKNRKLGDCYEDICIGATPAEMIKEGLLSQPIYYAVPTIDVNDVRIRAGDFAEDDLARVCDTEEHLEHAIQQWRKHCRDRPTLFFAVNVKHAEDAAEAFNNAGIPAAFVAGNTPIKEREKLYQKLANGELLSLASCEVLSEGFDCPPVSAAILGRPTKSKAKYIQQVGRVLRIADGKKNCIILDQAGNHERFGLVTDIERKHLTLEKSTDRPPAPPPVKECPDCGAIVLCLTKTCPNCGHSFERQTISVPVGNMKRVLSKAEKQLRRWLKKCWQKKYSPGYAFIQYVNNYGHKPDPKAYRGAIFGECPSLEDFLAYSNFLHAKARQKDKDSNWISWFLRLEFGAEAIRHFTT